MYVKVVISSFLLLFSTQTTLASLAQKAQALNALIAKAEGNSSVITAGFVQNYKTALQSYKKAVAQDKSKETKFKEWLPTYTQWDEHFASVIAEQASETKAQPGTKKQASQSPKNSTTAPKKSAPKTAAKQDSTALLPQTKATPVTTNLPAEKQVSKKVSSAATSTNSSSAWVQTQTATASSTQASKNTTAATTAAAKTFKQKKGITLFDIVENPQAHEFQLAAFQSRAQITQQIQDYVTTQLVAQAHAFSDTLSQAMSGEQSSFASSLQTALQTFDVAVHGANGMGGILSVAQQIYQQLMFGGTNPNIVEQAQSGTISNGSTFVPGDYAAGVGSYDPFGNLLFANMQALIDQAYAEMNAVVQLLSLQIVLPQLAVQASNDLSYYRNLLEQAANEPQVDTTSWWQSITQSARSFGQYVKNHFQDLFAPAVAQATQNAIDDMAWSATHSGNE